MRRHRRFGAFDVKGMANTLKNGLPYLAGGALAIVGGYLVKGMVEKYKLVSNPTALKALPMAGALLAGGLGYAFGKSKGRELLLGAGAGAAVLALHYFVMPKLSESLTKAGLPAYAGYADYAMLVGDNLQGYGLLAQDNAYLGYGMVTEDQVALNDLAALAVVEDEIDV